MLVGGSLSPCQHGQQSCAFAQTHLFEALQIRRGIKHALGLVYTCVGDGMVNGPMLLVCFIKQPEQLLVLGRIGLHECCASLLGHFATQVLVQVPKDNMGSILTCQSNIGFSNATCAACELPSAC